MLMPLSTSSGCPSARRRPASASTRSSGRLSAPPRVVGMMQNAHRESQPFWTFRNARVRPAGRTRAFLKVQNGCDSRCAFCIIPTTRGGAESRPLERVLADAGRRLAEGHPELVLSGINIGTYRDPATGAGLADLVRAVGAVEGLARLRISSIEPGTVDDRLLAAVAETAVVAPHLHIPLQSGDGDVLRAMGRSYDPRRYVEACLRAREADDRVGGEVDP